MNFYQLRIWLSLYNKFWIHWLGWQSDVLKSNFWEKKKLLWWYLSLLNPSSSHYLQKYSTCSPRTDEVSQIIRRKTELCSPRRCTDEVTLFLSGMLHFSKSGFFKLGCPYYKEYYLPWTTIKLVFRCILRIWSSAPGNPFQGTKFCMMSGQTQWQLTHFAATIVQKK